MADRLRWMIAAATFVAAPLTIGHAASTPVTTCGQVVQGNGVLAGDLDCSATTDPAVVLTSGARLDLAGFTLTGNEYGVRCELGNCRVAGPGTVRRAVLDPTPGAGDFGIYALGGVKISDGVVLENWSVAVLSLRKADIRDAVIHLGEIGVLGRPAVIADSTVAHMSSYGVMGSSATPDGIRYYFSAVRIRRTTMTGNTIDIGSHRRPSLKDTTCATTQHFTIPATPYGGGDEWDVCP